MSSSDYRAYEGDSADLDPSSPFFLDHVSRYWWASDQLAGQSVVDCACGKGYGSFILASRATSVIGVDMNDASLEIAKETFSRPNLEYRKQDVLNLSTLGRQVDAVVAFEVIEHLPPSETDRFLDGIRAALVPEGRLLISTPNHDVVMKSGSSVPEFHINNLKSSELRRVLRRHFGRVQMLGQFKRRPLLEQLAFDIDFFNLRHRLKRRATKPSSDVQTTRAAASADLFQTRDPRCSEYRFSPWHWRQAGLTVAIARL